MDINKKPFPLTTIRGKKPHINTNPDFQRPAVWTTGQKQLLIEGGNEGLVEEIRKEDSLWYRVGRHARASVVAKGLSVQPLDHTEAFVFRFTLAASRIMRASSLWPLNGVFPVKTPRVQASPLLLKITQDSEKSPDSLRRQRHGAKGNLSALTATVPQLAGRVTRRAGAKRRTA